MVNPWPTATIVRGRERMDAAVPPGTTVAGLLAMSEVDTSDADVRVTHTDGRPADPAAVIGLDVPSGVLLAVTHATASRAAAEQAERGRTNTWLTAGPAEVAAVLLAAALGAVGATHLGSAAGALPDAVRWMAAALALVVAAPLIRAPHARTPAGALVVPGLLALPTAALVPASAPLAAALGVVVVLIAAALVALVLHLEDAHPVRLAASAAWALTAATVTGAVLLGRTAHETGALVLALAVVLVRLAPSRSLPVPETQLIDLPLLMTAAPRVRAPETLPPSRITGRRVQRTVRWAQGVTATLLASGSLLAVVGGLLLQPGWAPRGFAGWGTVVLLVCASAALALVPRADASGVGRWLPRLASASVVAAAAWHLAATDPSRLPVLLATLVVATGLLPLLTVALTRDPRSALVGHMADVLQAWSLGLVLPAAFAASGLFDLFREVLS